MESDGVYSEFGLALRLGWSVEELRRRLSHREFVEWGAYFRRAEVERQIARSKAESEAATKKGRRGRR